MYMPFVRYKFESNSQPFAGLAPQGVRCICHLLDTSLKAIHNWDVLMLGRTVDVYAIC